MGGIVWRLAMDVLAIGQALEGPSSSVMQYGIGRYIQGDDVHYWDDVLSKDQLDLICGISYVKHGMIYI
jgi:hypothetical protein